MRMFALPAAFLLSFLLYSVFPQAHALLFDAIKALYQRFAARAGRHALSLFLLSAGVLSSLLGALHPVAAAFVITPVFTVASVFPSCARTKRELDSGKYARDIPVYEKNVRESCLSLAPAFIGGAAAPLILCALGMPLYIGCGLGWIYTALLAIRPQNKFLKSMLAFVLHLSESILCFLMRLCSGIVGRNPLRPIGKDARTLLLSILGIAEDNAQTHAPMAGDISQGAFLCCFSSALLLLTLTLVGLALC